MLPILRNALTARQQLEPAVLEAARNMAATADEWTRDGQFAVVVSAAP